jgi:carbon storage regulator
MLVLTRKSNQSIMIGDEIEISVLSVMGDKVRIGIQAPRSVPVYRREVYVAIQREREDELMAADTELIVTDTELIVTDTELIVTDTELIVTDTELIVTDPDLIAADAQLVTGDAELIAADTSAREHSSLDGS